MLRGSCLIHQPIYYTCNDNYLSSRSVITATSLVHETKLIRSDEGSKWRDEHKFKEGFMES